VSCDISSVVISTENDILQQARPSCTCVCVCVCVSVQMANNSRVLGIVLMHATGTTAGLFDMMKDKVCTQSLGFSPTATGGGKGVALGFSPPLASMATHGMHTKPIRSY